MEKIKHTLFRSWYVLETLEDRIYHIILDVAVFVSVASVVSGFLTKAPSRAIHSSLLILLFLIVLQFITMRYPKYAKRCQVIFVLGLNFVLLPAAFFASGGIYSGSFLFFLLGLTLCAILLKGNFGGIVFVISITVMELAITLSTAFPQYVQEVTVKQHSRSVVSMLLLASLALYSIVLLILRSYREERTQNEMLMQKMHELSVTDVLCGLYNRRELFRRLEIMYGSRDERERKEQLVISNRYIAMFDVDDFKTLNDTYGHSFGDTVLVSIAKVLDDMTVPEDGELTARYGGEEFVSVLKAGSMEEAYARVDKARQQITELVWEDNPEVRVSISGGLISCEDHADLTVALHDADELLYRAKAAGKDCICC